MGDAAGVTMVAGRSGAFLPVDGEGRIQPRVCPSCSHGVISNHLESAQIEGSVFFDVSFEPAVLEDRHHRRSDGIERDRSLLGSVGEDALEEIDLEGIPVIDPSGLAGDDRQAHVHGISVEDTGKGICDDGGDADAFGILHLLGIS